MADQAPEKPTFDLNEIEFRALAKARLSLNAVELQHVLKGHSDFDLNPGTSPASDQGLRQAAVLVPIVARAALQVLLTERTQHLSAHAGQIAFPGGRMEPSDKGPLDAALREAQEEIGLDRSFAEPLGFLPPYRTGTGFVVNPAVALIRPDFRLTPDPDEVADVFEVPLAFLMNQANHRIDSRRWRGADRRFYAMPYEHRYIWGATAGILKALHRRLFDL